MAYIQSRHVVFEACVVLVLNLFSGRVTLQHWIVQCIRTVCFGIVYACVVLCIVFCIVPALTRPPLGRGRFALLRLAARAPPKPCFGTVKYNTIKLVTIGQPSLRHGA